MIVRLKIVPDTAPDADGEWTEHACDFDARTLHLIRHHWRVAEKHLCRFVPAGFHFVQYKVEGQ